MRKNISGIVSVFLALIALPLYSFAIVSMDAIRIISARNHLSISNEVAMHSIMANYDRDLYSKYKIFSINNTSNYIDEYISENLEKNINENESNLYKAKLNKITIDKLENILDEKNLEKQIVDYMKLHGPYDLSKGVISLIKSSNDSKKYVKVLNSKFDYEEEYSKINDRFEELKKNLIQYENSFLLINEKVNKLNIKLNKLIEDIDILEKNVSNSKNTKDNSNNKEFEKILGDYRKNNIELLKLIKENRENYNNIVAKLDYLSKSYEDLQLKFDKWSIEVNKLEPSDIKNNFRSEIKNISNNFTKENIDKLIKKLKDNQGNFDIAEKILTENSILYFPKVENIKEIRKNKFDTSKYKDLPSLKNFKIYKYLLMNVDKKQKIDKNLAKTQKNQIEKFMQKNDELTKFDQNKDVSQFINTELINYKKSKELIEKDIKFENSISNFKKIYKDIDINYGVESAINNLYISLYLVEHFNNKLSDVDFNSQIEYILFGNEKLDKNISYIENQIFAMRFLLNSIYAFTNASLKIEANTIATAIAGWTGFGVPIIRTIVLGGMSLGESLIDLESINNSKNVVAYKNKASWNLSIKGISNLISKNIKEISNSAIDNIYGKIIEYSDQGLDKINKNIQEFANQSIDGVAQNIISEIVSPIQTIIENMSDKAKDEIISRINEEYNNLLSNIASDKHASLKKMILAEVKNKIVKDIENINTINFDEYFNKIVLNVESLVRKELGENTENLKNKIEKVLNEDKISRKLKINDYLDEYIESISGSEKSNLRGSNSGLSFDYKDYLVYIGLIQINKDKENILSRMMYVIDYELKKINPEFDVRNMYSTIKFTAFINVNSVILDKIIPIKKIEETIEGEY